MQILYARTGWAGAPIGIGYKNAFNALGHKCELFGDWNHANDFLEKYDQMKPELVWTSETQLPYLPLDKIDRSKTKLLIRCGYWSSKPPPYVGENIGVDKDLIINSGAIVEHYCTQWFMDTYYDEWRNKGLKTIALPLAADDITYKPVRQYPDNSLDAIFCGGYWPNKAKVIDPYLGPLAKEYKITVSGNGPWPSDYNHINIAPSEEGDYYTRAAICPNLHEPHSMKIKYEVNERFFKVLASRGFCISDYPLAFPDYFEEDEVATAKSSEEFQDKIRYYMRHPEEKAAWIDRGYNLVIGKNTYTHRIQYLLKELGLE